MGKLSQTYESVTIRRCKTNRLLFADDLVLLASFESGLQLALNGFATARNKAGTKISTFKTAVFLIIQFFKPCNKSCLMLSASWHSVIEAGEELQAP